MSSSHTNGCALCKVGTIKRSISFKQGPYLGCDFETCKEGIGPNGRPIECRYWKWLSPPTHVPPYWRRCHCGLHCRYYPAKGFVCYNDTCNFKQLPDPNMPLVLDHSDCVICCVQPTASLPSCASLQSSVSAAPLGLPVPTAAVTTPTRTPVAPFSTSLLASPAGLLTTVQQSDRGVLTSIPPFPGAHASHMLPTCAEAATASPSFPATPETQSPLLCNGFQMGSSCRKRLWTDLDAPANPSLASSLHAFEPVASWQMPSFSMPVPIMMWVTTADGRHFFHIAALAGMQLRFEPAGVGITWRLPSPVPQDQHVVYTGFSVCRSSEPFAMYSASYSQHVDLGFFPTPFLVDINRISEPTRSVPPWVTYSLPQLLSVTVN